MQSCSTGKRRPVFLPPPAVCDVRRDVVARVRATIAVDPLDWSIDFHQSPSRRRMK